jgi:hypothetical protein
MNRAVACIAVLGPGANLCAYAQDNDAPRPMDGCSEHHRQPPAEAVPACAGKAAGDAVTIATPRGDSVAAVCRQMRGQVAARPTSPPPGERPPGG